MTEDGPQVDIRHTQPLDGGVTLREHRPGDIGWVISRHGALYAEEYGWDIRFEALVAEIAAGFVNNLDPLRERCWIAELAGKPVGSVFAVRGDAPGVAKLRLLIVEPSARGHGVGTKLVRECIAFAESAGYHTLRLWTSSILAEARHIYQKCGFRLIDAGTPEQLFGQTLVMETWERQLGGSGCE